MRSRGDRLVAVATIGGLVVVAGLLGLVSLYLGTVTQAMSGVQRVNEMPSYPGRPEPVQAPNGGPVNYLVLATDAHRGLTSAYVAHLSGARDELFLIGMPDNLLINLPNGKPGRLEDAFSQSPDAAVRAVENLLQIRMDHLVIVRVDGFVRLADLIGGVTVDNRVETAAQGYHWPSGPVTLDGAAAASYVSSPMGAHSRLERGSATFVEILRGIAGGDVLAQPMKIDSIGATLNECLQLDAALTPAEVRKLALELSLRPAAITPAVVPMVATGRLAGREVTLLDPVALGELRTSLVDDRLDTWSQAHPIRWRDLPRR